MTGLLLAIEGIDGSGKGTQAGRLADAARAAGHRVASFSFPRYDDNPFSRAIGDYLNGEFGGLDEVHPELSALLYACDRLHARPELRRRARRVRARRLRPLRRVEPRAPGREARRRGARAADPVAASTSSTASSRCRGRISSCCSTRRRRSPASSSAARARARTRRSRPTSTSRTPRTATRRARSTSTSPRREGWRVVATAGEDGAARDVDEIAAEVWAAVEPLLRERA